jgi:hypothetical protein
LGRGCIDLGKVNIYPNTGLQHIHHDEADDQRDRCQHLKINDCLESDAADPGHVGHARCEGRTAFPSIIPALARHAHLRAGFPLIGFSRYADRADTRANATDLE